jgi:ribosomal-protein-alanine N-acetyltransferase
MSRFASDGHRAEFGYWVASEARGRNVASGAVRLMVDWTLQTTDLVRLEVQMLVDNIASARVAQAAGFELEATRRAWALGRDGRAQDALYYVLVRPGTDSA